MPKEQLERICFNCNYFFPSRTEASEYGICLEDKDFEPFLDELLEDLNYGSCQKLISSKEFPGHKEACEKYEEAEIVEIDGDDDLTDADTGFGFLRGGVDCMNLTPDEWWDWYREMGEEEKVDFLKDTLASGVTSSFALESGLGEAVVNMFDALLNSKQYGQMLELEALLHDRDTGIPDSDRHYIDFYCLKIHLFNKDIASITRSLQSLVADPVESIDLLIPVLDKLNYYGYGGPALQVSKEVYHRVRGADTLIGGAEEDFARTVLMNELQNLYQSKGQAPTACRKEFLNRMAPYDYEDKDELGAVFDFLLKDINCSALCYKDLKENRRDFYHVLSTGFCKYVFAHKGINFPTAYDIWMGAWQNFSKEAPEESGSMERFFELNQKKFYEFISGRFGLLSNKKPYAVAVLWGMPYVYDFLKLNQLVPEEICLQALGFVTEMKMELIKGQGDSIWRYSFVHSWGRPDAVSEEDFLREKGYFEKTFAEKADPKEYLPAEYFSREASTLKKNRSEKTVKYDHPKTGRNEPCPCGSGKKYKKCCGQS